MVVSVVPLLLLQLLRLLLITGVAPAAADLVSLLPALTVPTPRVL
jgi:hypothetical protein